MSNPADTRKAASSSASMLVRPLIAALAGYVPGEQPSDPTIVKLNTNENPYPPSARVRAAVDEACTRLHLYPDPTARSLRERAAALYGVDADGILVGNGSDELLALLMRAAVGPGDAVAYPAPTYSLYETLVGLQGGVAVTPPFDADWQLPAALFEVRCRVLIVCNPNSPSGTALPVGELEPLVAARRDCIVVIDEAYADFADGNALSLVGRYPHVIVLRTLSKSYSLAGLRVGLAFTTPDLVAELSKVKDSYNVGRLAQAAALAALEDQVADARPRRARAKHARAARRRARSSRLLGSSGAGELRAGASSGRVARLAGHRPQGAGYPRALLRCGGRMRFASRSERTSRSIGCSRRCASCSRAERLGSSSGAMREAWRRRQGYSVSSPSSSSSASAAPLHPCGRTGRCRGRWLDEVAAALVDALEDVFVQRVDRLASSGGGEELLLRSGSALGDQDRADRAAVGGAELDLDRRVVQTEVSGTPGLGDDVPHPSAFAGRRRSAR
jgi:histidinol-phosphate aminotransferase